MTSAPALTVVLAAPTFAADDVRTVTGDVWDACLASAWEPLEDGTREPLDGEVVVAQIRIVGDWSGAVALELSDAAAMTAAQVMLHADEVDSDEVADAVGELVNIIGGNLKSLLPTPSKLSLPQVAHVPGPAATDGVLAEHCRVEHCRVDLSWGTRPVRVRVWS